MILRFELQAFKKSSRSYDQDKLDILNYATNLKQIFFIIFIYKHNLPKISDLNNQVPKLTLDTPKCIKL